MCSCPEIMIDRQPTGSRNWNPDCLEHGTTSPWYLSPEQVAKRKAQDEKLRDLQRRAAEMRARR